MKVKHYHLGFIGFGHLAQILFRALENAKIASASDTLFICRDFLKMAETEKKFGISSSSLKNIVDRSEVLLLCVRPQQAKEVLSQLQSIDTQSKKVLSFMAGVSLDFLKEYFSKEVEIARVMPNIASSIHRGMTLLSFQKQASLDFKNFSTSICTSLGEVVQVQESQMDIGSSLAGSGPAFVLRLIQAMAKEGEKEGLTPKDALAISSQVFAGAAELVLKGNDPETLVSQIAVSGGMTEAGLRVFFEEGLEKRFQGVFQAAKIRSETLAQEI